MDHAGSDIGRNGETNGMHNGRDRQREHFWDALRALLMLLGIPYHVALSYQVGQDFIVHSGEGVPGFTAFAGWLHLFRMPAFFVIAGYFAFLLLARREPRVWLKGRFLRLGLPFVTCLITLIPLMNIVCELSNLRWHEALASWRHNSLTSGGYWIKHLWFIVVLLYFSTASACLVARIPRLRSAVVPARVDGWIARHFVIAILAIGAVVGAWEALAVEAFYKAGLATMLPQQILRLDETIMYAPWFALGCLLVRSAETRDRVGRFSAPVAAIAVAATVTWLLTHDAVAPMTERFVGTIAAIATTQVLIAAARRFLDRPVPIVRELTDASFVIYLFHLPLIVLLVWLAQSLPIPAVVKALGVAAGSGLGSYGVWLLVARDRGMSLLFDGVFSRPARPLPA